MTATDVTYEVFTSVFEEWTPAPPCEFFHQLHVTDGPAEWNVLHICPACGRARGYLLCQSGHDMLSVAMIECAECGLVEKWSTFVIACERFKKGER